MLTSRGVTWDVGSGPGAPGGTGGRGGAAAGVPRGLLGGGSAMPSLGRGGFGSPGSAPRLGRHRTARLQPRFLFQRGSARLSGRRRGDEEPGRRDQGGPAARGQNERRSGGGGRPGRTQRSAGRWGGARGCRAGAASVQRGSVLCHCLTCAGDSGAEDPALSLFPRARSFKSLALLSHNVELILTWDRWGWRCSVLQAHRKLFRSDWFCYWCFVTFNFCKTKTGNRVDGG